MSKILMTHKTTTPKSYFIDYINEFLDKNGLLATVWVAQWVCVILCVLLWYGGGKIIASQGQRRKSDQ